MQNTRTNLRPAQPSRRGLETRSDSLGFWASGRRGRTTSALPSPRSLTTGEGAGPASGPGAPRAAGGRTDPPGFQGRCPHPSARWAHGQAFDYLVCDHCRGVLEEGWPDHHPEVSRWLNEGGAVCP